MVRRDLRQARNLEQKHGGTHALAVNSADTSRGNADGGVRLGARDVPTRVNVELLVGVAVNVSRINLDGADRTCRVWRP